MGALPDMLTFTADGTKVVVANEVRGTTSIHVIPEPAGAALQGVAGLGLMGTRGRWS